MSMPGDRHLFTIPESIRNCEEAFQSSGSGLQEEGHPVGRAGNKRVHRADAETEMPEPKIFRQYEPAGSCQSHAIFRVECEPSLSPSRNGFQEAVAFAHHCSDCGLSSAGFGDFKRLNSEAYPDYGSGLLILFAATDQCAIEENDLKALFEKALIKQKYEKSIARIFANQFTKALFDISGMVTASHVSQALKGVVAKDVEELVQEVRMLFYEKGYMNCIVHGYSDGEDSSGSESGGAESDNDSIEGLAGSDEDYRSRSDTE